MTKTFFSKKRAEQFAKEMKTLGFETVRIWTDTDGFNQIIYIVKWF